MQASENQNQAVDSLCLKQDQLSHISYGLGYVCISNVPKMDNVVESLQPTTFKTITIPHCNLPLPQGPKWEEKR